MAKKEFVVRIGTALLAIIAIAVAAATIRSPIEPGGSNGVGSGDGEGQQPPPQPSEESAPVDPLEMPPFLEYLLYALVILLALIVAWYLLTHRRKLVTLIAIALAVGLMVSIFVYVFQQFEPTIAVPEPLDQAEPANETGGGGDAGDPTEEQQPTPIGPLLAVLAVVTAIFAGAILLSRNTDGDTLVESPAEADVEQTAEEQAAVAAAAGRAAERIDTGEDVDNEVYRAWRDMTELLEVDRPETSTPREFATAAIDAGLEPDHVDALTRLFEDVRYGHEETTEAMEAQAVTILRRIEAAYAVDYSGDHDDETENDDSSDGPKGGNHS